MAVDQVSQNRGLSMVVAPLRVGGRIEVVGVEAILPDGVEGVGHNRHAYRLSQGPSPGHAPLHLAAHGQLNVLNVRVEALDRRCNLRITAHLVDGPVGRCKPPSEVVEPGRAAGTALPHGGGRHADVALEEVLRHVVRAEATRLPIQDALQKYAHLVICVDRGHLACTPFLWYSSVPAVDEVEIEGEMVTSSLIIATWRPIAVPVTQLSEAPPVWGILSEHLVAVLPENDVDVNGPHDKAGLLVKLLIGVKLLRIPLRQLVAHVVVLATEQLDYHGRLGDPAVVEARLCDSLELAPLLRADLHGHLLVPSVKRLDVQVRRMQVDPRLVGAADVLVVRASRRPEEVVDGNIGKPTRQRVQTEGVSLERCPELQRTLHLLGVRQH
mmetsp:Transcript_25177/g.78428  ORF Transcript_25177/g.78428 Transcript_25177/m.78428 type:complete len:383 (+) Transcript_25177:281-1429(+)